MKFRYRIFEESLSEFQSVRVELVVKRLSCGAHVGARCKKKNRRNKNRTAADQKKQRVALATQKEIGEREQQEK